MCIICSSHDKYKKTLIYRIKLQNEPNKPQLDQEAKYPQNIFSERTKNILSYFTHLECIVLPSSSRLESNIKDSIAGSDPPLKHPTIKDVFLVLQLCIKKHKTS